MKYYKSYMDRQAPGDALHQKLLAIADVSAVRRPRRYWQTAAALAACCALIAALALWRPAAPEPPVGPADDDPMTVNPVDHTPADDSAANIAPVWPDYTIEHDYQFLARSGQDGAAANLPCIQGVDYQALDDPLWVDGVQRVKAPDGAFDVPLTKDQICLILWGGDQEAYDNARAQGGNVPWLLFWDNYALSGRACYNGEGDLYTVYIWGTWAGQPGDLTGASGRSFTVTLSPGVIPHSCVANQGAVTDSRGVAVEAWSYCMDDRYTYECAFLAHDVGTRFSFDTEEEDNWTELLFINWCTYYDGGLSLDHLLRNENIPAWEKYEVSGLAEAREAERFAAYLPQEAPAGFTDYFHGAVDYQEGVRDWLRLLWSKGYDDVSIWVKKPTGENWLEEVYSIHPTIFRVEDWSFPAQEAHKYPHDTGGFLYDFELLYPDNTVVIYRIAGMSAQEVWDFVEPTLG